MIGVEDPEADACVHASVASLGWRQRTIKRAPRAAVVGGRPGGVARTAAIATRSLGAVWSVAGARGWLLAVTVGSALVVALGFVHPTATYDPTLRATVETSIALCALAGTWLLQAQFVHSRRLRDLILFAGLLALTLLHVFSYALPAVLNLHAGSHFGAALWFGNIFVAASFAAGAIVSSDRVLASGGRPRAIAAGLTVLAVGLAELGGLLLRHLLVPAASRPVEGIASALRHPVGVVLALAAAALFGVAATAFARRARSEQPRIVTQLAGASVLLAAAGCYSLALPALPPNWVAPGLGLRLLAWALVFVAVVGRELDARAALGMAAATAERRRVARNLHDGLAQDLAFITAHGTLLAAHLGDEHPLTIAASRALAVSRAAITELSNSSTGTVPVQDALEGVAHELRNRFDIGVSLDAHVDGDLDPDMCEHVVRITGEAIANAARHGEAEQVSVSLRRTGDGVELRVRDDGCGISHAASDEARQGFGLRSMRERAAVRGGHLIVSEPSSGGTEVEVLLH